MKIIIQTTNLKCDMGTCPERAHYSVVPDETEKRSYLNLCDKCMRAFFKEAGAIYKRVPVIKGDEK